MIYFVESIPTGGKSYYSRKIFEEISRTRETIYYKEEYKNPLDLLRQARLTAVQYTQFTKELKAQCNDEYEMISCSLENCLTRCGEYNYIPYLHIPTHSKQAKELLYSLYDFEVDDGKVCFEEYKKMVVNRFRAFIEFYDCKKNYIFEGALLHNPLFTLLGFYGITDNTIFLFYKEIGKILSNVDYKIFLVEVDDIQKSILYSAEKRKNQEGYCWEKGFNRWFELTNKFNFLNGIEGIITFSQVISQYEKKIIKNSKFNYEIIERKVV